MHIFRRGTEVEYAERQPGVWYLVDVDVDWRYVAIICPLCRIASTVRHLTRPEKSHHTIADDGTVNPSVVCPHTPCTFHEYVRLDGWTPIAK